MKITTLALILFIAFSFGCARKTTSEDATSNTAIAAAISNCNTAWAGIEIAALNKTSNSTEVMLHTAIMGLTKTNPNYKNPCADIKTSYDAEIAYYGFLVEFADRAFKFGTSVVNVGGMVLTAKIVSDAVVEIADSAGTKYYVNSEGDLMFGDQNQSPLTFNPVPVE